MDAKHLFFLEIIQQKWKNVLENHTRFLFFNVSDTKQFNQFIHQFMTEINQDTIIYHQKFDRTYFLPPYFPFLNFIKENLIFLYPDETKRGQMIDKIFSRNQVYIHHRQPLKAFFLDQKIERIEEVLPFQGEIDFEKREFLSSIIKLIKNMSQNNRPIIFYIENLHYSKRSTLVLIKQMIEKYKQSTTPLFFIFSFEKDHRFINPVHEENWDIFIQAVDQKNNLFTCPVSREYKNHDEEDMLSHSKIYNEMNTLDKINLIIRISHQAFYFFALHEAKEYLDMILKAVRNGDLHLDDNISKIILKTLGDVHHYLFEQDSALISYNYLISILQEQNEAIEIYDAYRKMSLVYLEKGSIDSANRFKKQALRFDWNKVGEKQLIRSYLLFFHFDDPVLLQHNHEKNEKLISLLISHQMDNTLSLVYTNISYLVSLRRSGQYSIARTRCLEGIEIAKNTRNQFRLAIGYHSFAILEQMEGHYKNTYYYFKKSLGIRIRLKNRLELIKSYNGLGFYNFVIENFNESTRYFKKALKILSTVNDYQEICLTLYNVGMINFYNGQYHETINYLENVLFIMGRLNMERLPFHSREQLQCILGIAFIKVNNIHKAVEYKYKIEHLKFDQIIEDQIYHELFLALYHHAQKAYGESEVHFIWASDLIIQGQFGSLALYVLFEYGRCAKEWGDEEMANTIFLKGLEFCGDNYFDMHRKLFRIALNTAPGESIIRPKQEFTSLSFKLDYIIENAKQESILNQLHHKIDEMNFLNNLQNLLVQTTEEMNLIYSVMNLIINSFLIFAGFIFKKENGQWITPYTSLMPDQIEMLEFEPLEIFKKIRKNNFDDIFIPDLSITSQLKEYISYISSIIILPLNHELNSNTFIMLITKNKENRFSEDDFNTLTIAAKQFRIAQERIILIQKKDEQMKIIKDQVERTKKEMNMARMVQENMIASIEDNPYPDKITIATAYHAMEQIGGDLFDVIQLTEPYCGFLIADVSGHGVPAALVTSMLKISFTNNASKNYECHKVCEYMNLDMDSLIGELNYFVTAYYARLNTETGVFEFSNAGHHAALLLRAENGNIEELTTKGLIMGIEDDAVYQKDQTVLKDGDRLLLYTDGIVEAGNRNQEMYTTDRLFEFMKKNKNKTPQDFVDALIADVNDFCNQAPPKDDRAVLLFEYHSSD